MRKIYMGMIVALIFTGCGNDSPVKIEQEKEAVWNDSNWDEAKWQ